MRTVGGICLKGTLGLFMFALLLTALRSSQASGEPGNAAGTGEALPTVQPCSITCPANISTSNLANNCGANVTYNAPTSTGACSTIICTPPSNSFFPVGTTTVNCFSAVCNTIYALGANAITTFDSASPGTITTPVGISGLNMGESVVAIDFRPATGGLYGLGVAATTARLLLINTSTSAATQIGSPFTVAGTAFGFDFNPTNDRLRITSDADQNLLVNPNDGVVTIQGNLNPGNPTIVGSAYSNNFAGASSTTLYAIDSGTDQLATQVPTTGTLTNVGALGVDTSVAVGFDISACGTAYAALNPGGATGFYTINLTTGAATLVGGIAVGGLAVQGIAVAPPPSCSFTVTVNDTQPPVITCPGNITAVTAVACPPASSTTVTFTTPTASDNCPGVTVVCSPPSGSTFAVGTTTVTCTATDATNNTATCSFTVTVFNVCLQDDSNPGNVAFFNTVSGAYRVCCNGTVFTGTGTVTLRGCTFTLSHNPGDRRLTINVDFAGKKGSAALQFPPGVMKCTIMDRDLTNNTCTCP